MCHRLVFQLRETKSTQRKKQADKGFISMTMDGRIYENSKHDDYSHLTTAMPQHRRKDL